MTRIHREKPEIPSASLKAVKKEADTITKLEKKIMRNQAHFEDQIYTAARNLKTRTVRRQKNNARLVGQVKRAALEMKSLSEGARKQWSLAGRKG